MSTDLECPHCHLPLRCEACGTGEADVATSYINDELELVAIRLCHRCNTIASIPPAQRRPQDGRAVVLGNMTARNMDAYCKREEQRTPVSA